jgi:hypothetical protein
MKAFIAGDESCNTQSGSVLLYKLSNTPILSGLIGRIEYKGRVTQRISEEKQIIRFYNSMWVDKEVDGPCALYGRIVKNGLIIVWNVDIAVGETVIYLNYDYIVEINIITPLGLRPGLPINGRTLLW